MFARYYPSDIDLLSNLTIATFWYQNSKTPTELKEAEEQMRQTVAQAKSLFVSKKQALEQAKIAYYSLCESKTIDEKALDESNEVVKEMTLAHNRARADHAYCLKKHAYYLIVKFPQAPAQAAEYLSEALDVYSKLLSSMRMILQNHSVEDIKIDAIENELEAIKTLQKTCVFRTTGVVGYGFYRPKTSQYDPHRFDQSVITTNQKNNHNVRK